MTTFSLDLVKDIASRSALELRPACLRGRLHAVPLGRAMAICGHVPTFEWLEPSSLAESRNGVCSPCRTLLTRAGYYVSWAGVIAQEPAS